MIMLARNHVNVITRISYVGMLRGDGEKLRTRLCSNIILMSELVNILVMNIGIAEMLEKVKGKKENLQSGIMGNIEKD